LGGLPFFWVGSGWYGPSSKVTCNLYSIKWSIEKVQNILLPKIYRRLNERTTRIDHDDGKSPDLDGNEVKVGEKAPDFTALDNALTPVQFSSLPEVKSVSSLLCSIS